MSNDNSIRKPRKTNKYQSTIPISKGYETSRIATSIFCETINNFQNFWQNVKINEKIVTFTKY